MMDTTTESLNGVGYEVAGNVRGQPPRRQYALDVKRRIVEETFAPGASVSVVARRHDVNANQVFEWRKQYRRGKLGSAGRHPAQTVVPSHEVATRSPAPAQAELIRVGVVDPGIRPPVAAVPVGASPGLIEIKLGSGIKVRVDAGFDEALLRRVLAVIKELA